MWILIRQIWSWGVERCHELLPSKVAGCRTWGGTWPSTGAFYSWTYCVLCGPFQLSLHPVNQNGFKSINPGSGLAYAVVEILFMKEAFSPLGAWLAGPKVGSNVFTWERNLWGSKIIFEYNHLWQNTSLYTAALLELVLGKVEPTVLPLP